MTKKMEARVKRALEILDEAGGEIDVAGAEADEQFLRTLTPAKIVELVSPYVIGQDEALYELARHTCLFLRWHFAIKDKRGSWTNLPAMKALTLTGTTASGKSHIIKIMCKVLGLKLVRVNFAAISGEGYRGQNFSSYLQMISEEQEANPNAIFVLFCDEVDKSAFVGWRRDAEPSANAQVSALAVMDSEEKYAAFAGKNGEDVRFEVDMTSVMWVLGGAYTGIESHVRKRLLSQVKDSYGLLANGEAAEVMALSTDDLRRQIEPEDLVAFGMISEFVGRSSRIVNLPTLSPQDLARIVNDSDHSLQARYQALMPEGSTFVVDGAAAREIARQALKTEMGARHLDAVLAPFAARALEVAMESGAIRAELSFDESRSELSLYCASALKEVA